MVEDENIKYAANIASKFEFYLISLIFTILALAIQSSSLITAYYQFYFEYGSWICLLASGLIGLSRMEYIPVMYRAHSQIFDVENKKDYLKKILIHPTGGVDENNKHITPEQLQTRIDDCDNWLKENKLIADTIENTSLLKYKIHKYLFAIGLLLLLTSRILVTLHKLYLTP
ncbi:MAG: hypothetical protein ACUZ8N_06125 [Candidatus Scalindua sp.]